MAYRAHIKLMEKQPDGTLKRLGMEAVKANTAPGFHVGTRYGEPGVWIERETKSNFVAAVEARVEAIRLQGLVAYIDCTNAPSLLALRGHRWPLLTVTRRG
jgi:hypothetical protein